MSTAVPTFRIDDINDTEHSFQPLPVEDIETPRGMPASRVDPGLVKEFEDEIEGLRELPDPAALKLEEIPLRPRKSDISVSRLALAWAPWRQLDDGTLEPLY